MTYYILSVELQAGTSFQCRCRLFYSSRGIAIGGLQFVSYAKAYHEYPGTFAFRGQKVEIVEYARVTMPIAQIEEMLVHLDKLIAWLVHVRDNVKALLDSQDMYCDKY
ncbi:hypothetical protein PsorP6_014376 [Peronosclerospora sorghi]|uniref:Uncharacterized protein n=1 Tax=Peronosclerospora sorghi TaxID=230839 RepID=A0ACC0VG72_9STRA|nr:hypothetical protein PsorP6_014376 [Peronosclerospora sorghi]